MTVRNPLTAALVSLCWTAILAPLLAIPIVVFRYMGIPPEVSLFYGIAAFAIAGAVGGRSGTFAFMAFPVAFLGGFLGYVVFFSIAGPSVDLLFAVAHATIAGLVGWAVAIRSMAKIRREVQLENEDKRRCHMCGTRVGPKAKRCWSCRASLTRLA